DIPAPPQTRPAGAAVPYAVELGLTVLHTALYAALFLFAYLQLWLLLYYRERRLSYHTLCLFLCLLWAALRTTLFSFYLQNSLQALRLQQPFAHWLLYCLPGCLLFSSLCLLNLYFAEVSFAFGLLAVPSALEGHLLFLVVNLTCAMLIHGEVPEKQLRWTVLARALVNDSLFILCAISLACLCLPLLPWGHPLMLCVWNCCRNRAGMGRNVTQIFQEVVLPLELSHAAELEPAASTLKVGEPWERLECSQLLSLWSL
uniref:G protein-coupled receptor 137C n=1 Tax=Malurus cyaneus samueli TaxID=2593467 RepID=A0A8C5TAL0_9PASS